MIVGIPTLNRYDRLVRAVDHLLAGRVAPQAILVVDNGGGFRDRRVEVIRPGRNLGVAGSWNLLYRLARSELLLMNDDVLVGPDTLAHLRDCPRPFVAAADGAHFTDRARDPGVLVSHWSCFLQRDEVWRAVGAYDEAFWPAYYEDADYDYRMRLAGYRVTQVPPGELRHEVSATLAALAPDERREFQRHFEMNRRRYLAKWGGPLGREAFTSPFNNGNTGEES